MHKDFFKMKLNKISSFKAYKENPSIAKGIETRQYLTKGSELPAVVTETGEAITIQTGREMKVYENDTLPYNKVFRECYSEIKDFESAGLKVWCYINVNLIPKRDDVIINIKDCMEFCNYVTAAPVYKGIVELLNKEFIYRREGTGNFFINVNKFFNGKRV